jgi:hypothetical protein
MPERGNQIGQCDNLLYYLTIYTKEKRKISDLNIFVDKYWDSLLRTNGVKKLDIYSIQLNHICQLEYVIKYFHKYLHVIYFD